MTDEKSLKENGVKKLDDMQLDEVTGGRRYICKGAQTVLPEGHHITDVITKKHVIKPSEEC